MQSTVADCLGSDVNWRLNSSVEQDHNDTFIFKNISNHTNMLETVSTNKLRYWQHILDKVQNMNKACHTCSLHCVANTI